MVRKKGKVGGFGKLLEQNLEGAVGEQVLEPTMELCERSLLSPGVFDDAYSSECLELGMDER